MTMKVPRTVSSLRTCLQSEVCAAPGLPFLFCTRTILRPYSDQVNIAARLGEGEAEEQELQAIKERWSRPRTATRGRVGPSKSEDSVSQQMRSARRQRRSLHVPFEGSTGSANPAERLQNTTMTPREMQIFEELFRKGIERRDAEQVSKPRIRSVPEREFPELLRPLAEETKQLREQALRGPAMDSPDRQVVKQFEIKDQQSKDTQKLMDDAETDVALWDIVKSNVLVRLKDMPDDIATQGDYAAPPALLQHYMTLISTRHPRSSLGLLLLPELKKIGPLSFTLGATTELYNQHMRLLWRQYTDVDEINSVLADMDAQIYPFNDETQDIISSVLDHVDNALDRELGPALQMIWTMDRRKRAVATLRKWRATVAERLEGQALRQVQLRSFEKQQKQEEEEEEAAAMSKEQVANIT